MSIILRYFWVFIFLFSGCEAQDSSQFLIGNWISTNMQLSQRTQLTIEKNGKFSIFNISSKAICEAKTDELTSGIGTWEYDQVGRKLILAFEDFSKKYCTAPYGANAFVDRGIFVEKIIFYPDGPDAPQSLVALIKQDK